MTALIIIGSILLFFAVLLCISVSVHVSYIDEKLALSVNYLFISYDLLKERKEKPKKEKKRKKKKEKNKEAPEDSDNKKEDSPLDKKIEEIADIVKAVWGVLKKSKKGLQSIKKHLVFYKIRVFVLVGGSDAHEIGTSYAQHATAITSAIGALSQIFFVKEPVLWVNPDFLATKTIYEASARIRIRPIFALFAALMLFLNFLKALLAAKFCKK